MCGVCEAPLTGTIKQLRNAQGVRSKPYLLCHPTTGGKGCLGIMLPEMEAYVIEELFAHLDSPEFRDAQADDDHEAERARLVTALDGIDGQRRSWPRCGGTAVS